MAVEHGHFNSAFHGLLDDLLHRVLDGLVAEDIVADLGHRDCVPPS